MSVAWNNASGSPTQEASASPGGVVPDALAGRDRIYRLNLDQYHQIAALGVIDDKAGVALIDGLLVQKMTKNEQHVLATILLEEWLHRAVPAGWFVTMQNPVALPESASEPEPDAMVVRGSVRGFAGRRIGPTDVGLVIEVADSSLRSDQTAMKAVYARSSVPVYWLVNLIDRRVEVYTDPTGAAPVPDYRTRTDFGPEAELPLVLDGVEAARVTVRELLP